MGTDRTADHYQGFLIPDERVTNANIADIGTGTTESSYTEAGARAGTPDPDQSTLMAIEGSGTQTSQGQLEIYTQRAGNPGPEEGGFLWRDVAGGDGVTEYKGWDGPQMTTGWDSLVYGDDEVGELWLNIIRLKSGKLLTFSNDTTSPANTKIDIHLYDPTTSAWTDTDIDAFPDVTAHPEAACLCELPSGRVLFFCETAADVSIDAYYSDDEGATWAIYALRILETRLQDQNTATPDSVRMMRAAYNNGQIVLLIGYVLNGGSASDFAQWASEDFGQHFTQVDDSFGQHAATAADFGHFDVAPLPGGGFVVGTFASTGFIYRSRKIGSAYDLISSDTPVTVSNNGGASTTDRERGSAMWIDEDSTLYYLISEGAAVDQTLDLYRSTDFAESWEAFDYHVFDSTDDEIFLEHFSVASTAGRALMVTRTANTINGFAADGPSVNVLHLGGFGDQTVPVGTATYNELYQDPQFIGLGTTVAADAGFAANYIPVDLPNAQGWTLVETGGTSVIVDPYVLSVATTVGTHRYYTHTASATAHDEVWVQFGVDVASGSGDKTTNEIAVDVLAGDHTSLEYQAAIRLDDTGFRVYDPNLAGYVDGGAITLDLTAVKWFRVAIGNSNVIIWTSTDQHAREWTKQVDASLTNGTGASWSHVHFGNIDNAAATETATWYSVGFTADLRKYGPDSFDQAWREWVNPADLHPKSFPTLPAGVADGVKIRAASGPSRRGETFKITAKHDYGIENIDPRISPSPRQQWRSLNDDSELDIVWDLEALFADSRWENAAVGIALINCNFRLAYLEEYVAASWGSLINIDTATGWTNLDYNRYGRIFEAKVGGSTVPYLWAHEHAGDTLDISADVAADPVRIVTNTGGMWVASAGPIARLTANTDDLTGLEGATGRAAAIWRKNYAAVVYQEASKPALIRLRIPAQTTATGDFRIGAVVIGPVAIFGHQYDRGWKWTRTSNTTVDTALDGTRRSRELGPRRRMVEFAWTETAVDTTLAYLSTPSADYVTGTDGGGGLPIGSSNDTPRMVAGTIDRLAGPDTPVAFLGALTPQTGDGTGTDHITDTTTWTYGRITSDTEITVDLGDEGDDEVHKLGTITVEEEI